MAMWAHRATADIERYNCGVRIRRSRCDVESVLITRYQFDKEHSDAELTDTLEAHRVMLHALRREGRYDITILDCADSYSMPARQRRIQADWNRSVEEIERVTTLGKCFVMRSVMTRGLLTAVFWCAPPTIPPRVFASTDEALAWAYELCEAKGIKLSEADRKACRAELCEE
jgi:hypothetical protein